jgi:hypothetical protein
MPGHGPDVKACVTASPGVITVAKPRSRQERPQQDERRNVLRGALVVTCGDDLLESGLDSFALLARRAAPALHEVGARAGTAHRGSRRCRRLPP